MQKKFVDYRNAIWLGYEQIKKDGYINTNTIIKIQGTNTRSSVIRKLPGTELKIQLLEKQYILHLKVKKK